MRAKSIALRRAILVGERKREGVASSGWREIQTWARRRKKGGGGGGELGGVVVSKNILNLREREREGGVHA